MGQRLMIYGATGYTGKLLAEEAVRRGLNPILAGRNAGKLAELAGRLGGPETRCFDLDDPATIRRELRDVGCVLHAAGPFAETASQMMEACIAEKVHYLDITGEFTVYALAESLSDRAEAAGVMLMPGVGWDVVPSDCVALHTARRAKAPGSLRLALNHFGGVSRGSVISGAGIMAVGPKARRDGVVVSPDDQQPTAFDFGHGPQNCVPMAMGDIVTAWKSTRIPNIEVYFAISEQGAFAAPDLSKMAEGPTAEERDAGRSRVLAEVTDADGSVVRSLIETSSGYSYTGESGIEVARRVLAGDFKPGFQSPASAYGSELATSVGGGRFIDLD